MDSDIERELELSLDSNISIGSDLSLADLLKDSENELENDFDLSSVGSKNPEIAKILSQTSVSTSGEDKLKYVGDKSDIYMKVQSAILNGVTTSLNETNCKTHLKVEDTPGYLTTNDINPAILDKNQASQSTQTPSDAHRVHIVKNSNTRGTIFRAMTFRNKNIERRPVQSDRFNVLKPINNKVILKQAVQCLNQLFNDLQLKKLNCVEQEEVVLKYTKEITTLTNEVKSCKMEYSILTNEFQAAITLKSKVEEELVILKGELVIKIKDCKELEQNNEILISEVKELKKSNEEYKDELKNQKLELRKEIESKVSEIKELQNDKFALNAAILTAKNQSNENEKCTDKEIRMNVNRPEEITEKHFIVFNLRQKLEKVEREVQEKETIIKMLQKTSFVLNEEQQNVHAKILKYEQKLLAETQNHQQEVTGMIEKFRIENDKLFHQSIQKNKEITELKNILSSENDKTEEIKELQDKIQTYRDNLSILKQKITSDMNTSAPLNHTMCSNCNGQLNEHHKSIIDQKIKKNYEKIECSKRQFNDTLKRLLDGEAPEKQILNENYSYVTKRDCLNTNEDLSLLREQLDKYHIDIATCKEENTDLINHIKILESKLINKNQFTKENRILKEDLAETKNEVIKLEDAIRKKDKDMIDNLLLAQSNNTKQHEDKNKLHCCFQIKIRKENLEEEIIRLEEKLNDHRQLQDEYARGQNNYQKLKYQFENISEELKYTKETMNIIKQQQKQIGIENRNTQSQDIADDPGKHNKDHQVINVNINMDNLKEEFKTKDLSSNDIEHVNIQKQLLNLQAENKCLIEKQQEYQQKQFKFELDEKEIQNKMNKLKTKLAQLQKTNEHLTKSMEIKNTQKIEGTRKTNSTNKYQALSETLSLKNKQLNIQINNLRKNIEEMKINLKKYKKLEDHVEKLQTQLEEKGDSILEKQKLYEEEKLKSKNLQEKIGELKSNDSSDLRIEIQAARNRLSELTLLKQANENTIKILKDDKCNLKMDVERIQRENIELRQQATFNNNAKSHQRQNSESFMNGNKDINHKENTEKEKVSSMCKDTSFVEPNNNPIWLSQSSDTNTAKNQQNHIFNVKNNVPMGNEVQVTKKFVDLSKVNKNNSGEAIRNPNSSNTNTSNLSSSFNRASSNADTRNASNYEDDDFLNLNSPVKKISNREKHKEKITDNDNTHLTFHQPVQKHNLALQNPIVDAKNDINFQSKKPDKSLPSWLQSEPKVSVQKTTPSDVNKKESDPSRVRTRNNVPVRKNENDSNSSGNSVVFKGRGNKPIVIQTGGLLGDVNDFLSLDKPPTSHKSGQGTWSDEENDFMKRSLGRKK